MNCPFCNEDDFDLEGLKLHLKMGYCEVFDRPFLYCGGCGKCLDCLRIERNQE